MLRMAKWTRAFAFILIFVMICIFLSFVDITETVVDSPVSYNSTKFARQNNASAIGVTASVSSENVICSDIGLEMLKKGGSAVDAAIATTICIGTLNLQSSGIGGGGFMLYSVKGKSSVFDFRETAPKSANKDMFVDFPEASTSSGLAVGIPGELRGMQAMFMKYGKLRWQELFQPSIELAKRGWVIDNYFHVKLQSYQNYILNDSALSKVLAPEGKLLQPGDIMKRPVYAKTLEIISEQGPKAFYNGEIGKSLVETINSHGGNITMDDFSNYKVVETPAIESTFRDKTVITVGAPSSGGVLLTILNILENYQIINLNDTLDIHRMVEAMKFAYAQRGYYGDPADSYFRNITENLGYLTKKTTSKLLYDKIQDGKTFPPGYYMPKFEAKDTPGTTHISILTADGEALSLTSTINLGFGSKIMDPNTGIILNNQMDDFSTPSKSNFFGYPPSPYNFIEPGKKPASSATPVIITDKDQIIGVIGASGGSQIISSTAQTILRVLDMKMDPYDAIHEPRFHHQLNPNTLIAEKSLSSSIIEELTSKGHHIERNPIYSGVTAVFRKDGLIIGASDDRKNGKASAF